MTQDAAFMDIHIAQSWLTADSAGRWSCTLELCKRMQMKEGQWSHGRLMTLWWPAGTCTSGDTQTWKASTLGWLTDIAGLGL